MRTIVVYILRLLVDETEPGALRGFLRDVANGEERTFSSEQGLLDLLHLQPKGQSMINNQLKYTALEE